jgi:hypothetical protein
MKNPRQVSGAGFQNSDSSNNNGSTLPNSSAPAQEPLIVSDGVHIGTVWKSPRDKTRCIQGTLKSFNGSNFADFRVHTMDGHGRMIPTPKGITVSVKRLGQFAALVGNAYRRAATMGLTPRSS